MIGALRRDQLFEPSDLRYIHGAGPVTLARGEKADLWVAIVAGADEAELLANAAAAQADVAARLANGDMDLVLEGALISPRGLPSNSYGRFTKPGRLKSYQLDASDFPEGSDND